MLTGFPSHHNRHRVAVLMLPVQTSLPKSTRIHSYLLQNRGSPILASFSSHCASSCFWSAFNSCNLGTKNQCIALRADDAKASSHSFFPAESLASQLRVQLVTGCWVSNFAAQLTFDPVWHFHCSAMLKCPSNSEADTFGKVTWSMCAAQK